MRPQRGDDNGYGRGRYDDEGRYRVDRGHRVDDERAARWYERGGVGGGYGGDRSRGDYDRGEYRDVYLRDEREHYDRGYVRDYDCSRTVGDRGDDRCFMRFDRADDNPEFMRFDDEHSNRRFMRYGGAGDDNPAFMRYGRDPRDDDRYPRRDERYARDPYERDRHERERYERDRDERRDVRYDRGPYRWDH